MTRAHRTLALLITIPIGIAIRYNPVLPWIIRKYAGSGLWAAALYFLIAILIPRHKPAIVAAVAAVLIELSRLVPEPHIDYFRTTLAGKLLLGRYFSMRNIAAYLIAIALAACVDTKLATRK